MGDLISIGGLWLNDGKKGKYMSGTITRESLQHMNEIEGDIKILVFKNDKDGNEKRPDYNMNATSKEPRVERVQQVFQDDIPDDSKIPF